MQLTPAPMDKRFVSGIAMLALAACLIVLSFFQIYYIEGGGDGDLLWDSHEAFLFIHGHRRGYHVSYLGYTAELIKQYFGVIPRTDDEDPFTLVVRISGSGVERFEEKGMFHYYTPVQQVLYAGRNDGNLWKWNSTHFELATTDEIRSLGGLNQLSKKDFNDVNGWSGRYSITSKIKGQFPIAPDGVAMNLDVTTLNLAEGVVFVDLVRPDHAPEVIFRGDFRPHKVSRAVYERTFSHTH